MAEKAAEEGYISVVDEEPEIFELLKWDQSQNQKQSQLPQQTQQEKEICPEKAPPPPKSREEADPFDLPEPSFIETFRLSKDLVRNLIEELKPVMPETIKSIEFSAESKILATLSFYASGKFQKVIHGKTDPNVSHYFVATAVQQVTEAFNNPSIIKKYIHFPHLRNERDIIKARFYMKYGMPNVVGCIDCTHIPITRPENDTKKHFNKSFHSKKVQIICDGEMYILSVHAAPGALPHDALLTSHAVKNDLDSLNHSGEQCWLVGGPFYTQKPYLMAPIPKISKKSPISPDKYYSNIQTQTHNIVIDTIRHLKCRWKCLQATCNKQFDPKTVSMIVTACCILHNICNRRGLPVVPLTPTEERLEAMKQKVANGPVPRKTTDDPAGIEARNRLAEILWNERRIVPETCSNAPKKRMSKKDRLLEAHNNSTQQMNVQTHQPMPQPVHQPILHHHHHHQMQQQMHHEDMSKRPRIVMNNPTYGLGVTSGWGQFPQH